MDRARGLPDRAKSCSSDDGITLVEVMIAILVFTIFIAILLSSIIGITNASTRAQVIARSSSGVLNVFQSFDRQVRYADSINFPGTGTDGFRYVEFRTPSSSAATGVTMCTQWRFEPSTGQIKSRKWQDLAGSNTPTAWVTQLSVVFDDGANYPFGLMPASLTSSMQQLTLTIDAGNATLRGASISANFAARNSSQDSQSNPDNNVAGVSDNPVCLGTGTRS